MKVVLPAPLAPMSAVRTPGWKAPVMPFRSSSSLGPPGFACAPPQTSASCRNLRETLQHCPQGHMPS